MVRQASLGDMGLDSDLQNIIHRDSCAVLQKEDPVNLYYSLALILDE